MREGPLWCFEKTEGTYFRFPDTKGSVNVRRRVERDRNGEAMDEKRAVR
jgi:hypothetical protein